MMDDIINNTQFPQTLFQLLRSLQRGDYDTVIACQQPASQRHDLSPHKDASGTAVVHNLRQFQAGLLQGEPGDLGDFIHTAECNPHNTALCKISEELQIVLTGNSIKVGEIMDVLVGKPRLLSHASGCQQISVTVVGVIFYADETLGYEVLDIGINQTESDAQLL